MNGFRVFYKVFFLEVSLNCLKEIDGVFNFFSYFLRIKVYLNFWVDEV